MNKGPGKLGVVAVVLTFILFMVVATWRHHQQYHILNMENTMSPILAMICEDACGYENVQVSSPAYGGKLIYKREPVKSCITGMGNVYYIRCYEWDWDGNGTNLWYRPTHDIPLGCHSCIDESEVRIPYWDRELQNAELGVKFYR